MRVGDVMSKDPICCNESITAQNAAKLLAKAESGVLPVLENSSRRLRGVITDRDLCLTVLGQSRDGSHTTVAECMTHNPFYCHAEDDAYAVLELISVYGLRGIVVLDRNGEVKGVVSATALAAKFAAASKVLCSALEKLNQASRQPAAPVANMASLNGTWKVSSEQFDRRLVAGHTLIESTCRYCRMVFVGKATGTLQVAESNHLAECPHNEI